MHKYTKPKSYVLDEYMTEGGNVSYVLHPYYFHNKSLKDEAQLNNIENELNNTELNSLSELDEIDVYESSILQYSNDDNTNHNNDKDNFEYSESDKREEIDIDNIIQDKLLDKSKKKYQCFFENKKEIF